MVVAGGNSAGALDLIHLAAINSAGDGGVKIAFHFLPPGVFRHLSLHRQQLLPVQQTAGGRRQLHGKPIGVFKRLPVALPKLVFAFRGADHNGPAFAVGKRGADYIRPDARLPVAVFVGDQAVEIQASQPVGIVRAEQLQTRAIRVIDAQFGLVYFQVRDGR